MVHRNTMKRDCNTKLCFSNVYNFLLAIFNLMLAAYDTLDIRSPQKISQLDIQGNVFAIP